MTLPIQAPGPCEAASTSSGVAEACLVLYCSRYSLSHTHSLSPYSFNTLSTSLLSAGRMSPLWRGVPVQPLKVRVLSRRLWSKAHVTEYPRVATARVARAAVVRIVCECIKDGTHTPLTCPRR